MVEETGVLLEFEVPSSSSW